MWTEEQLKEQLAKSQESLNAVLARIKNYDAEISKLNEMKNQELQEALRLDGESRILKKQIDGETK
jgi:predicted nuclease with TOPRIM domain